MTSIVTIVVTALLMQQAVGDGISDVTKASNEFANKLYEKISKKPGNVLVCPISVHVALALVHQGAAGPTASELASVLRLQNVNSDIPNSYRSVLTNIQDETLKIATKLYPALGFQLNENYIQTARNSFLSDVEGIDFTKNVEAAGKINKFVEDKTNNKIHNLISPDAIDSLTRLIIINAVHFQASWKKTFPNAYEDYFRVTPDNRVKTKLMTQTDYFEYKEDPYLQAKVLKMDYATGGYSMLFILPNSETGLPELESKLANVPLENLLKGLNEMKVEVTIPKFKLELTNKLKETLEEMGLSQLFSNRADLSGIARGGNLYVSDVIQKTFINVHENGTEAAAATAYIETLSAPSSDERIFYARRPFHFKLVSTKLRLALFTGKFVRPEKVDPPEESDAVQFSFEENKNEASTPHSFSQGGPPPPDSNSQGTQILQAPDDTDKSGFSSIGSSNHYSSSQLPQNNKEERPQNNNFSPPPTQTPQNGEEQPQNFPSPPPPQPTRFPWDRESVRPQLQYNQFTGQFVYVNPQRPRIRVVINRPQENNRREARQTIGRSQSPSLQ